MSVTSLDFQNQYTTDGVSFVYSFTWTTISQNEVTVYLNNVAQVLGTNFTVQLNPTGIGGTITFLTIPAANQALLIQRIDDFLQPNNFGNNQALPPQTLVQMFDKLTIMCQQLLQQSTLSLALSLPAAAVGVNATLPFPIVAGSLIAWDDAGTGTAYVDPVEAGYVLTDNGIGNLPSFQPATGGGGGGGNVTVSPSALPTYQSEMVFFNNTLGTLITGNGPHGATGTVYTSTGPTTFPTWSSPTGALLKASAVTSAAPGLPTSGHWTKGQYFHYGDWTQTGNITFDDGVFIYHNGGLMDFINGYTCTNDPTTGWCCYPAPYGVESDLASGMPGFGLGAPTSNAYAANNAGGGGGACGGYGGSGGGTVAKEYNFGGLAYNYRAQFTGSSGGAGNTSSSSFTEYGGRGAVGLYIETTGSISFSTVPNVPSIANNGETPGGTGSAAGGSGGGSGGIVVIRAAGIIGNGNGTNTIQCKGGSGGGSSTGGGGGGGGGGIIDIVAGGAITATGWDCSGGTAGAGSSTQAAVSGSNYTASIVENAPIVMSVF